MTDVEHQQKAGDEPANASVITREKLYEMVWAEPLKRIGERFGVSGGRVAELCDRADVPYPAVGHWSKVAVGKKVTQPPLPPLAAGKPASIDLAPPRGPRSAPRAATAKSAAPSEARTSAAPPPASPQSAPIQAPSRLVKPHSIIAGWLDEHERRRRESRSRRDSWSPPFVDWTPIDRRRHLILDAIFKAMEKRGYMAKLSDRHEICLAWAQEKIVVKLREKQKQVRRPLTPDEKRWGFYNDRPWRQELAPTGVLVFTIDTYFRKSDIRREWRDLDGKPLEDQLDSIVETLALAGPALVQERVEREQEEAQRREAERLRQVEADRQRTEANQWRRFVEFARAWEEVALARRFLAELAQRGVDSTKVIGGRRVAEWTLWVEQRAAALDPVEKGSDTVFENLSGVRSWDYRQ